MVERTYDWWQRSYDWSQRSWVIARGKSVATTSMVMFKTGRATLLSVVQCTTNRLLTDNIKCGDVSGVQVTPHTMPDAIDRTIDRTIDRLWLPLIVRSSPIVVDRATTRTTNRTMT